MDWISIETNKEHTVRERTKAKALKKTQWWLQLLNDGTCYYCKNKFTKKELTMDHIVPLSRGGKSNKGNIVPACKQCNSDKKYFTPVDLILKDLNLDNEEDELLTIIKNQQNID